MIDWETFDYFKFAKAYICNTQWDSKVESMTYGQSMVLTNESGLTLALTFRFQSISDDGKPQNTTFHISIADGISSSKIKLIILYLNDLSV